MNKYIVYMRYPHSRQGGITRVMSASTPREAVNRCKAMNIGTVWQVTVMVPKEEWEDVA